MIIRILKKIIFLLNIDIKKKEDFINKTYTQYFNIKKKLIIFDIGMHKGESLIRFDNLFKKKRLIFHTFEPLKNNIDFTKKKFSGFKHKIVYNQFGLGERNCSKIFFENIKSNTSSFNKVNSNSEWVKVRSKENKVTVNNFIKKKHLLEIRSLDSYLSDLNIKKIDILKIDTQGYEYEVLKGSIKSLKKKVFKFIELEIILSDAYENKTCLGELELFLKKFDYEIVALSNGGSVNHMSFEADILFKLNN